MKNLIITFVCLAGVLTSKAQIKRDNIMETGQGITIHCIDGSSINFYHETLKKETVAVFGDDYTVFIDKGADMYGYLVEHNYDGLKLSFLPEEDMQEPNALYFFELTGSKYFLKIGDHAIKVGNHISTIKEGFPISYNRSISYRSREENKGKNGGTYISNGDAGWISIVTDDKGIIIRIGYTIPS